MHFERSNLVLLCKVAWVGNVKVNHLAQEEGPVGVKWELGFGQIFTGKWNLGPGTGNQENKNWDWDLENRENNKHAIMDQALSQDLKSGGPKFF